MVGGQYDFLEIASPFGLMGPQDDQIKIKKEPEFWPRNLWSSLIPSLAQKSVGPFVRCVTSKSHFPITTNSTIDQSIV